MFRTLARLLNDPTLTNPNAQLSEQVFQIHPLQLSRWLEQAWSFADNVTWANLPNQPPFLGDPQIVQTLQLPNTPDALLDGDLRSGISRNAADYAPGVDPNRFFPAPAAGEGIPPGLPWDHIIYALLIENTGVFEILAEVVRRYKVGETLEAPSLATQRWLHATEELFFRDPPSFHITSITSQLAANMRVARRNAIWRLTGLDVAHPLPPGVVTDADPQPWKRDVGAANTRFHDVLVQLLQQVWLGIENFSNTSGANPTDASYIAQLAAFMRDQSDMRRRNGQLAREEFVHVTTMSWFHLTVDSNTPLVIDLKAQGTDPADRLEKLGSRVGYKPSPHARELFDLAEPLSTFMRFIELGAFDTPAGAQVLFTPGTSIHDDMNNIIDLWQSATGDPIKQVVRMANQAIPPAQPRALPTQPPAPAPAMPPTRTLVTSNGSHP